MKSRHLCLLNYFGIEKKNIYIIHIQCAVKLLRKPDTQETTLRWQGLEATKV